jgi:primosomal protein N' (replication factor Y) (superfamily II helicase)
MLSLTSVVGTDKAASPSPESLVEVAVGLPVRGFYHYSVPARLGRIPVGSRVLVPFGPRGVTGVVVRSGVTVPSGVEPGKLKDVKELLDEAPALDAQLVSLCLWIADYYEAAPGEVFRAALPAGTAVVSTARPRLTQRGREALAGEGGAVPRKVRVLLGQVAQGLKPAGGTLGPLVQAGLVSLEDERVAPRIKARTVPTIQLARPLTSEERIALAKAPRRAQLVSLLEAAGAPVEISALRRVSKGATAALQPLLEAGVIERGSLEVSRDPFRESMGVYAPADPLPPTAGQAGALAAIATAVTARTYQTYLLHGITGSGKTEVYLQAIASVLEQGRGALVLVPEIALTPQLAARFRARFGDRVAVLHSGLSDGERYDQWRRLRSGQAQIALGARSAVFAPVADLGIVVVDEEHDPSFKQEEGVRYHARDVALVRAQRASAVCVLGSATPSLESYANAQAGRFTLLELPERAHNRPLPEVELVDLRTFRPDPDSALTAPLAAAIEATLAAGEQVILFLNRRGFATFVVCVSCGTSFRCPNCAVSLTYHQAGDWLRCHYCGHAEHTPIDCAKCPTAKGTIRRFGLGTERIEAALRTRWPKARVARLDRDTAAGRGIEDILRKVAAREVDILIGTQMVTKGHDFPGVTLVGVLSADSALSLPDFRAAERTFQLLTQVAGRAGRGDRPGRVLVQTYTPEHPSVACARTHDYKAFYASEVATRAELLYPPHGRLVAVRIEGADEPAVRATADELARRGQLTGGLEVLGPSEAPLRRLKGRYRWHIWIKAPQTERPQLRAFVRQLVAETDAVRKDVRVTVDVDPLSAL